ncbi:MAG: hypothetical protein EOO39_15920 [Cytophagaceae bacterium]|nr:MAG: hypothetical protein EOO39_15920 [Cytophagaceae bacterium]
MTWIASTIARLGDYLVSMSNGARLRLVIIGLLLLGGGSIYKLTISIRELQKPLPATTPDQLIKPMEGLFKQTSAGISDYRIERNRNIKKLDSLSRLTPTKTNNHR